MSATPSLNIPSLRLQYFDIEGPAEKSRLALRLSKIPFLDDRVDFSQWPSLKSSTPYGQLPLLHITTDASVKVLAQSDAILRYVGRLGGLYPSSMETDIDEALGLVDDAMTSWRPCLYIGMNPSALGHVHGEHGGDIKGTPECDAIARRMRVKWMEEELPKYCGFFKTRLAKHSFLCGDQVTIADCALIPQLRRFVSGGIDHVPVDCLDAYPEVKAYYERFHALPEVKAWYEERAAAAAAGK
jgi:glutathione S-transferase